MSGTREQRAMLCSHGAVCYVGDILCLRIRYWRFRYSEVLSRGCLYTGSTVEKDSDFFPPSRLHYEENLLKRFSRSSNTSSKWSSLTLKSRQSSLNNMWREQQCRGCHEDALGARRSLCCLASPPQPLKGVHAQEEHVQWLPLYPRHSLEVHSEPPNISMGAGLRGKNGTTKVWLLMTSGAEEPWARRDLWCNCSSWYSVTHIHWGDLFHFSQSKQPICYPVILNHWQLIGGIERVHDYSFLPPNTRDHGRIKCGSDECYSCKKNMLFDRRGADCQVANVHF